MRKMKKRPKEFIPSIFTVMNMFIGFMAMGFLMRGDPIRAGWLILFACFFDVFDGKLARLLGIPTRFGAEFDSFADTISFCAAPSLIIYLVYVEGLPPLLGGLISFIPILFGTIRLAKYNLDQDKNPKSYFIGLPTPMNAVMIVTFLLFNYQMWGNYGDPRIVLVMTAFLGFLMVSKIRFSKFPLISLKKGKSNTLSLIGVGLITLSTFFFQGLILFPLFTLYILWSITQWMLDNDRFEEKSELRAKL